MNSIARNSLTARCFVLTLAIAGFLPCASAQATSEAQKRTDRQIDLDVMVTDADGKAVSGLTAQDFTVLDNGKTTAIQTFRESRSRGTDAATAGNTEVVILFDTVNSSLPDVAYARDQVGKFLRQDGGKLAYPVELLAFNGNGAERIADPSLDGNALAAALENAGSNLHPIRRSEAFWGAVERLQLSLGTLGSLAQTEARVPGRKLLFWISPGWPLLVGTQNYPTSRELQAFFDAIVAMSNGLREARIVLYSLDPVRTPGADMLRWNYYKDYLKGVPDARRAVAADLALQVLATQSGGDVINFSDKDMWQEIANHIAKAEDFYSLTVAESSATHADEYHSLKITLDKPGLTVHTRSAYYGQP
jgi:VWFA-related protein